MRLSLISRTTAGSAPVRRQIRRVPCNEPAFARRCHIGRAISPHSKPVTPFWFGYIRVLPEHIIFSPLKRPPQLRKNEKATIRIRCTDLQSALPSACRRTHRGSPELFRRSPRLPLCRTLYALFCSHPALYFFSHDFIPCIYNGCYCITYNSLVVFLGFFLAIHTQQSKHLICHIFILYIVLCSRCNIVW